MTRTAQRLQVLGWLALASLPAGAGTLNSLFIDPQDGAFDMTQWLGTQSGFMPVPIVVTEPAIGYGGGAALVFFHDSISNRLAKAEANAAGRLSTPSLSAVGGVAYGSLNLKFHGHDGGGRDQSVAYGLDAPALLQDVKLRLADSDAFAGLRYLYARVAGGGGVRYLLARGFRLRGGIDVAWGPEDTVFYITVGNAW